jgi:hypothetical protein
MLDIDTPGPDILHALEDVALCIRGLWILKSHYIYKNRVLDARNYLLYLFQRVSLVKRSIFNEVARLPLDLSKTMLEEIACIEPESRSWVLKLPEDKDFIRTYPDIVTRQKKLLEAEGLAYVFLISISRVFD